jgi:hypothetical protein
MRKSLRFLSIGSFVIFAVGKDIFVEVTFKEKWLIFFTKSTTFKMRYSLETAKGISSDLEWAIKQAEAVK